MNIGRVYIPTKLTKAIKAHKCIKCRQAITPGTLYKRVSVEVEKNGYINCNRLPMCVECTEKLSNSMFDKITSQLDDFNNKYVLQSIRFDKWSDGEKAIVLLRSDENV